MPSFFDLQKFAATGIASADMSAFDKARALAAFGGGKTQTLTGVPPFTFKANGNPLLSWSMLGNGQQTGTPTPDNPVMPEFVGVRTENLVESTVTSTVGYLRMFLIKSDIIHALITSHTFTLAFNTNITLQGNSIYLTTNNPYYSRRVSTIGGSGNISTTFTFTDADVNAIENALSCGFHVYKADTDFSATNNIMLNSGSTALPYEPYGWAEKITCAGQTVPVYLGQTQTVRRIKKYEFTGAEALQTSGSGNARFFYMTLPNAVSWETIMSDRYVNTNIGSTTQVIGISMSGNSQLRIRPDTTSTVADFKSYLAQQYAAGTPVTVWYVLAEHETGIVNEPLCKIGNYADELSSTDAGVSIPTVKGTNTLTVDTELQPSSMTITYKK